MSLERMKCYVALCMWFTGKIFSFKMQQLKKLK